MVGRFPEAMALCSFHFMLRFGSDFHILSTWVLLVIPSKMQVLSIGMYCLVIILITSWATIPPVNAEMLCSSPLLARATSFAAWTIRGLEVASGTDLLTVAIISGGLAVGTCEVAFKAR